MSADMPWKLDLEKLEVALSAPGALSIIVISGGEVNTGRFSLEDVDEWKKVRALADKYGAWIHVDGGEYTMTPAGNIEPQLT